MCVRGGDAVYLRPYLMALCAAIIIHTSWADRSQETRTRIASRDPEMILVDQTMEGPNCLHVRPRSLSSAIIAACSSGRAKGRKREGERRDVFELARNENIGFPQI